MLFFNRTDLDITTPRRSLFLCKKPTQPFPPTSDLILFHILCGAGVREPHGAVGAELGPTVCRHKTWEKCNTASHQWKWSDGSLTAKGEAGSQVWPGQGGMEVKDGKHDGFKMKLHSTTQHQQHTSVINIQYQSHYGLHKQQSFTNLCSTLVAI